ncbi:DUF349 domain-containing protein, partial [bacterium AH-315-K03]|nr:DUF349 domain-containing protein [bacterium AH-315-K03]
QWLAIQSQELEGISVELQRSTERALQTCQSVVDEKARVHVEQEQAQEAIARASTVRDDVLDELRQLIAFLYTITDIEAEFEETITQSLSLLDQRWVESEHALSAGDQQRNLFTNLCDGVLFLQKKLIQLGSLAQQLESLSENADASAVQTLRQQMDVAKLLNQGALPETVNDTLKWIEVWDKKQDEEKASIQQSARQIGGLIRKANEFIECGQVRHATGVRRSIEQKLENLEVIPESLSGQLEQLNEKLEKLQDWRSYAVKPKMETLVQQMQALVGSDLNPDVLVEKIKSLQEQWKSLSKGGGGQYQELWDSFHELAQIAYEPCKEHFQKKADIRQNNLEKRKKLLIQLAEFFNSYHWETADWKMVEEMVRLARQEWRSYVPIERSENKKVQVEFEKQLSSIHQYLDAEYKKNTLRKKQLIDQARLLVDRENVRSSVEDVKKLQIKWKAIGVIPRKTDQSLWQEFRVFCDRVFEQRQLQSSEFKVKLNASKTQAEALCVEVETLGALNGKELLNACAELERLQLVFQALGALPKSSANAIKSKFSQAVERFEMKLIQAQKGTAEKIWMDLLKASGTVGAYELAVVKQENIEHAKQLALDVIGLIEQWPKNGKDVIEKKFAKVGDRRTVDFEANEAALRLLCIRMEVLAGVETPKSDHAIRMDYQVKRLQQTLGQKTLPEESDLTDLIYQWVAVPPVSSVVYDNLLKRFSRSRQLVI